LSHAAAILCLLAAAALGAAPKPWRYHAVAILLGSAGAFVLSVAFNIAFTPDVLGAIAAAAAGLGVARPRWQEASASLSGVCAAVWAAALSGAGLPLALVLPIAVAVPFAALALARNPRFAPPAVRDEALVIVAALAVVVAVIDPIADGWRSAVALTASPLAADSERNATWALGVALAALAAGGLYGAWRRR
jgi:hypothetical protein